MTGSSSNCVQEFPLTSDYYSEISSDTTYIVFLVLSGILCLITLLDYGEKVWYCFHNFYGEIWRNRVISLLGLFPVISVLSFLNLVVPRATPFSEFLGAGYVGFALYQLLNLLVEYFGGHDHFLHAFDGHTVSFRRPPCCCCLCCSSVEKVKVTRTTIRTLFGFSLQLIVVKPFVLFIAIILWSEDVYPLDGMSDPARPGLYLKIVGSISTILAVYGLVVMFSACRHRINKPRLLLQFSVIKLALTFYDIQLLILTLLAKAEVIKCVGILGSYVRAFEIQCMLLTLEMFLLSLLARLAFRHEGQKTVPAKVNVASEKQYDRQNSHTPL